MYLQYFIVYALHTVFLATQRHAGEFLHVVLKYEIMSYQGNFMLWIESLS